MCFDIHAHSQLTNSFLYGNVVSSTSTGLRSSKSRCNRQLIIPYLLAESTDDFSLQYTSFNIDEDKAGTHRRRVLRFVC